MNKFTVAIGTRPELIKLAPVVHTLRNAGAEAKVLFTGQHPRQTLKPLMDFFHIVPDIEIPALESHGSIATLSHKLLQAFDAYKQELAADCFIVQGDRTSAFAAAYFAFCQRIPVAHVEAGLRTRDLATSFPEEANRQLITRLAHWHFAPTFQAARNLMREGVAREQISVVGNTGIDSLLFARKNLELIETALLNRVPEYLRHFIESENLVLVTVHRRENHGEKLECIAANLRRLANELPNARLLLPLHPNPSVRDTLSRLLGDEPNILLCDPLPYLPFIYMMSKAKLIITDSGGIQEEAPSLGVPVLVLREQTERVEAVEAGFARLVGVDGELLVAEAKRALVDGCAGSGTNPFGDGTAAKRIVKKLTGADKLEKNIVLSMIQSQIATELESAGESDPAPEAKASPPATELTNVIPLPTHTLQ